MLRKAMIASAALIGLAVATPASAGGWGGSSTSSSSGGCGRHCGSTTSTSGGSTTSGGTQVPEPGMLGIAGAGLIGLGLIRRRRATKG
jgi:hypothetical protein